MTRKSKPKRACGMCKYYKYLGNNRERRKASERRRTPEAREWSR